MTKRVSFTKEEFGIVELIIWHFSEYMMGDDRPDHALGKLKKYRDLPIEEKRKIYSIASKLRRKYERWDEKNN